MNIAIIFAGGTGQRMHTKAIPKQFLSVHSKPIIVHTVEKFQNCTSIDKIIIVSLKEYIEKVYSLKEQFHLDKVSMIVPGGITGQESIYNGLKAAKTLSSSDDDIVLIHDGVRPIIDNQTIINNIECVKKNGNCITVAKSIETVLVTKSGMVKEAVDRASCYMGRAPQSFYLKDILRNHLKAINDKKFDFIDSAMLMSYYGIKLFTVEGPVNNIKVTTPIDFMILRALLDAEENQQLEFI